MATFECRICPNFVGVMVIDGCKFGKCKFGATGGIFRTGDQVCDLNPHGVLAIEVRAQPRQPNLNPRKDSHDN